MSTIASQHAADFGNGRVNTRRYFVGEFSKLRVVRTPQRIRADFGPRRHGSLQLGDGTLKSCYGLFELAK